MILNLGCGLGRREGALNVDRWAGPGVDCVYDLERTPWPWPDGAVTEVWALDILEHLADFLVTMRELHRVMCPGAMVHVRTSNWRTENSFTDPTHRRFLTLRSFDFWDPVRPYAAKYPQYAEGRHFRIHDAREDGEELVFELERL